MFAELSRILADRWHSFPSEFHAIMSLEIGLKVNFTLTSSLRESIKLPKLRDFLSANRMNQMTFRVSEWIENLGSIGLWRQWCHGDILLNKIYFFDYKSLFQELLLLLEGSHLDYASKSLLGVQIYFFCRNFEGSVKQRCEITAFLRHKLTLDRVS